jgi:hypothetical protein
MATGALIAPALAEGAPTQAHVADCLADAAHLYSASEGQNSINLAITSGRTALANVFTPNADAIRPDCTDVDTTRDTDVVLKQNGKVIGRFNNLLNAGNDNGQELYGKISTSRKFKIGANVVGIFNTTARSPYSSAQATTQMRISFPVRAAARTAETQNTVVAEA